MQFLGARDSNTKKIFDTFLAEIIINGGYNFTKPTKPYFVSTSLKGVVNKYCGVDLDKSIRGVIHKEYNSDRVIKYSAKDIEYLESVMFFN